MTTRSSFKRLTLRAVLRKVSPMVIRVQAVPDSLTLARSDEIFCTMLGWEGLGYSFYTHGREFTSFLHRSTVHQTALRNLHLRSRDTYLNTCGGLDL